MKGSMACFNTQVLLGWMLRLKSKNYSLSKRKLCQRREKERYYVALLSSNRKLSSWVNLGRSEQPDLKAKLEGTKTHPHLRKHTALGSHHQMWCKECKVLGILRCHFMGPWKKYRISAGSLMPEPHRGISLSLFHFTSNTTVVLDLSWNTAQESHVWNRFLQH